ncbi:SCO family protein [Nguyenibacter vanlangensis]|uniref:SCO family protein n=1 Tax=Nguyenibacter vanlangensis TaxID=1216886 RepID=A0ABZ3D8K9_9PROT
MTGPLGRPPVTRRAALAMLGGVALAACRRQAPWYGMDVRGISPDLAFALHRAPQGRAVTQADFRGTICMLYLGYTLCPDLCPMTMNYAASALARLGAAAGAVRVLFVTVDPLRDTDARLGSYVAQFGPSFVGLRGSDDALARLAARYRLAYDVTPGPPYRVTHSEALYVFDRASRARLLISTEHDGNDPAACIAADLDRLLREPGPDVRGA